ncbi:MAG: chromate efflux transporter [Candidatus Competibacteraceae bacterium]|nr:chromate efflux transporter [Candidatus Competibacteraceae bacterium]
MTASSIALPSLRQALLYWLKLGFISFGGPAGQISLMHQELVERRRWISERRFVHALNYCMMLPGPEAQQLATYLGWLLHGTWGGILAGALFVLPSLFILIALSWIYMAFGQTPVVAGVLYGVKPAVTALVALAAWRIGSRTLHHPALWMIAVAAFLALTLFAVPFPAIILGAGLMGLLGGWLAPAVFQPSGGHAKTVTSHDSALIDDHTPPPPHTHFSWPRLLRFIGIGLLLWGGLLGLLAALFGGHGTLTQMGVFFTKAALLTFGGAYAVLPYVYQGAVGHYQWLSAAQMVDGLALGETTPGPLIIVVAFVGFVGGWGRELFGPEALALAGMFGATVATVFTFLPSFLFILIGGPLIESTHGNLKFTAPLIGITAAVVGVIGNLALFFAWHTLWPAGWKGSFEGSAALIGIVAFGVLYRQRAGVIPVIGGCAVAGLGYKLLTGF